MILGYHAYDGAPKAAVAPSAIGTTLVYGGKIYEIEPGHSFYTTSPQTLYKERHDYVALVEGEQSEAMREQEKFGLSHGGGTWVSVARKIPIIKSFPLTDELMKELGFRYIE